MDRATFTRFREIVYENSGISLNTTKEAMVSARIAKRMRILGIRTYKQYLQYLVQDTTGDEITRFLDVISTNVTSFFREHQHFEFLSECLTEWLRKGKTKIRIWSAASSTGEEPLSIVMSILVAAVERNIDFRILATDLSTRVLAKAQQGMYEQALMENVPDALKRRFFSIVQQRDGVYYQVKEALKKYIVYRRLNLSEPPFPMRGQLDIVFCRNVMIYFDNQTRERLVAEIHRLLLPGGYLLTGHAESLTSLKTDFKCIRPSVYQKKG